MRRRLARFAFLLLMAALAPAWGAHITDRLAVGLYDAPELKGKPQRLLTTGTPLEVLERKGDAVRVRLGDGASGWLEARYVTEEKPAAAALLEARAEIRRLKERLAASGEGMAAPRSLPSAEQARLGLELGKARARIAQLEGKLAELSRLQASQAELERLRATQAQIRRLLGMSEAEATERTPPAGPWQSPWTWLGLAAALLAGAGLGAWWMQRRVRRRFGGLRI